MATISLKDIDPAQMDNDVYLAVGSDSKKVGIGTTTPSSDHKVHIYSNDAAANVRVLIEHSGAGNQAGIDFQNGTQSVRLITTGDYPFTIYSNAKHRLFLNSGSGREGNITIADTVVANKINPAGFELPTLSVMSPTVDKGSALYIGNHVNASQHCFLGQWGTSSYLYNAAAGPLYFGVSNTAKARIDQYGRWGIGDKPDPSAYYSGADELIIKHINTGEGTGITIHGNSTHGAHILFGSGTTAETYARGWITYDFPTDSLLLGAKGLDAFIITGTTGYIKLGNDLGNALNTVELEMRGFGTDRNEILGYKKWHQMGIIQTRDNKGYAAGISFGNRIQGDTGVPYAEIAVRTLDDPVGSYMYFNTASDFVNGVTTPGITIDPRGNVGFCTYFPDARLHIKENAWGKSPMLLLDADDNGPWALRFQNRAATANGHGTANAYYDHGGQLHWHVSNGYPLTMAKNSTVGINRTSPVHTLDVNGTIRCTTLLFDDGTSFSSVASVGYKSVSVDIGNGSSNVVQRAQSVVNETYGGMTNGLVLVSFHYRYYSRCGNGGCYRWTYPRYAYNVIDGNWIYAYSW